MNAKIPDEPPFASSRGAGEEYSPWLRVVAIGALLAGATASLGLTLFAGRHNQSRLLVALFAGWVLSPFAGLVLIIRSSWRWRHGARDALFGLILMITAGSVAVYKRAVSAPPLSTPAAPFLLVPLGSWLLMAIVIPRAGLTSRLFPRLASAGWLILTLVLVAILGAVAYLVLVALIS